MAPTNTLNNLGWKAFFTLLMLLQVIALGVMWQTYDAIEQATLANARNSIMIDSIILPTITRHELALENFQRENQRGS